MPDLLPCPFCGQVEPYVSLEEVTVNTKRDRWATNGRCRYQIACGKCATHSAVCKDEAAAVAAWNTRESHKAVHSIVTALYLHEGMARGPSNAFWEALEVLDPDVYVMAGKDLQATQQWCAARVGMDT